MGRAVNAHKGALVRILHSRHHNGFYVGEKSRTINTLFLSNMVWEKYTIWLKV